MWTHRSLMHASRVSRTWPIPIRMPGPRKLQNVSFGTRRFASSSARSAENMERWSLIKKMAVGSVLFATTAYVVSSDVRKGVRHVVLTSERVGIVTVATFRCFRLYYKTLQADYERPGAREMALKDTHLKAAKITLEALEKNGGIYIKLGQHISALTHLLPEEWTSTMIPLQDQCPQSSMAEIEQMFQRDMDCTIDEMFSEFDPSPVGVASLAQVHIARLRKTGEKVAVKVQHPSLREFVPLDIFMTQTVFELMRKVFPEYPLTWLGDEMQSSIYVELDFTNEAQNAERTSQYFQKHQNLTALRVPQIVSAIPRILIMEYVAGARLDNLEYMKKHKIKPQEVSSCLAHIFNDMIFSPGVGLHCDPHGGNIAIRAVSGSRSAHNFEIILYDHGLYRQIPLQMKRDYSHFWLALLEKNEPDMRKYTEKITGITDDQTFLIFIATITGRPPDTALNLDLDSTRNSEEAAKIQESLSENNVMEKLMEMLSEMPRVFLLILKTNDLTRQLDEDLKSPLGPKRTFLIMAQYCARLVYEEKQEYIKEHFSSWSFKYMIETAKNIIVFYSRTSALQLYDGYTMLQRLLGGWKA